jgi:hypothetical protein
MNDLGKEVLTAAVRALKAVNNLDEMTREEVFVLGFVAGAKWFQPDIESATEAASKAILQIGVEKMEKKHIFPLGFLTGGGWAFGQSNTMSEKARKAYIRIYGA